MSKEIEQIKSEKGITVVKYGDSFLRLKILDLDEEVDVDRVTKIDANNLIAELITTPVLITRWGKLLADCDSNLAYKKLDFDIFCAKTKKEIRDKAAEDGKKITVAEVDDAIVLNAAYKIHKKNLIDLEKTRDIVNNAFWSLKDKSNKLDKLSLTITKDDLDTLSSTVLNGVDIVIRKPRMK